MKNTIQRQLVLSAVRDLGCHATAEEIYRRVAQTHPSVSRGTVYRNLNRLVEEGEISKVQMPGEPEHFDHICDKHPHVICVRCGKVFDVDMAPTPPLLDKIRDTRGFDFLECHIVFRGVCPVCLGKEKEQNQEDF